MRKSAIFPHILAGALLGLISAESLAQTFKYRIYNKMTTSIPVGAPALGGAGGSGETGGTGAEDGTTSPPPPPPTYATTGVRWFVDGTMTFQLHLTPGERRTVTLRNTSTDTLRGWLGTSDGGRAYADLSASTCTQNVAGRVPTNLAPGAECNFVLVGVGEMNSPVTDNFSFKGMDLQPIPDALYLPAWEVYNPGPGGGGNPDA